MDNCGKRILITGIAGFIGFHLARALHARGDHVIGCDNFNDYYDPSLKEERARLLKEAGIDVVRGDITEEGFVKHLLEASDATHLVHLAAQAGVRYSLTNPKAYLEANLNGFFHVLEALRSSPIPFLFASSSSVYGFNQKIPFSEEDRTDQPANFYSATKKCNETMAAAYHKLYGIPTTALRFFTVYGPYGRPDMAYYSFTKAIAEGHPINLFNGGDMQRDFTYIDDIVEGTIAAIDLEAQFEIFNLGNNKAEPLLKMVEIIETHVGKKANVESLPMQPGEIQVTFADVEKAKRLLGYSPKTSLEEGMAKFLGWYNRSLSINR